MGALEFCHRWGFPGLVRCPAEARRHSDRRRRDPHSRLCGKKPKAGGLEVPTAHLLAPLGFPFTPPPLPPAPGPIQGLGARQPSPLLCSEGARPWGGKCCGARVLQVCGRRGVPGSGGAEGSRTADAAPRRTVGARELERHTHSGGLRDRTSQSNPRRQGRRRSPGESPRKPSGLPPCLCVPRSENTEGPRSLRLEPAASWVRGVPVEQGERTAISVHFATWPLLGPHWRAAEAHRSGVGAAESERFQTLKDAGGLLFLQDRPICHPFRLS